MTEQQLWDFVAAWERKDVPALMKSIADDCVYTSTTGPDPGTRYISKAQIEAAFTEQLSASDDDTVTTFGPLHMADTWCVLEWTVTHRATQKVIMRGVDLCEFRDNRITRKDVFRKSLT